MSLAVVATTLSLLLLGAALVTYLRANKQAVSDRLQALLDQEQIVIDNQEEHTKHWLESQSSLQSMNDWLGKYGYWDQNARRAVLTLIGLILFAVSICSAYFFFQKNGASGGLIGFALGLYMGSLLVLGWLRMQKANFHRKVLFYLPITLESLILLVESGLGILPAIEKATSRKPHSSEFNPVLAALEMVYDLAANGMPLNKALEIVSSSIDLKPLRHVLLHLDVSAAAGGELLPSLRSLSNHVHREWRLSVESRIRRLENFVVFPVFVSVIGLMLVTVAVPLIPVLDLQQRLSNPNVAPPRTSDILPNTRSLGVKG